MPRVADRSIVAGGIRICILTVSYLWNSMETVEYCSAMDRRFGSVHSNVGGRRSQRTRLHLDESASSWHHQAVMCA